MWGRGAGQEGSSGGVKGHMQGGVMRGRVGTGWGMVEGYMVR